MILQKTTDECCVDFLIECQDFVIGDQIYDSVLNSLFTTSQDPICEKGGWWADPDFGSRVIAQRGRTLNETMSMIRRNARAALQWLVQDGVANSVEVDVSYSAGCIVLNINIYGDSSCQLSFTLDKSGALV